MLRWLIGIILGKIICESSNWQHIERLKITILGANWQLFRLERIAKCSYFILSTQNIKFHWIVMKIKKFLLPIWWYNRDLFPLRNKYNMVFVLNGINEAEVRLTLVILPLTSPCNSCNRRWRGRMRTSVMWTSLQLLSALPWEQSGSRDRSASAPPRAFWDCLLLCLSRPSLLLWLSFPEGATGVK